MDKRQQFCRFLDSRSGLGRCDAGERLLLPCPARFRRCEADGRISPRSWIGSSCAVSTDRDRDRRIQDAPALAKALLPFAAASSRLSVSRIARTLNVWPLARGLTIAADFPMVASVTM
jgi:hypothetical protein